MSRYLVGITKLWRDPHVRCFEDHMLSIVAALRALGHEVEYAMPEAMAKGGRLILWGANHVHEDPQAQAARLETIPRDAIVFQTEQVSAVNSPTFFIQNWIQYRDHTVWEYAQSNLETLEKLGMTKAVLCPIGYVPAMTKITPADEQDIDVLFYGTGGGPRREILNALDDAGLKVVRLFGKYGLERDAIIARAKVVINLRYYEHGVFEIFRCSHLFANRVCVVNEAGGRDRGLEELARRCTAYTERAQLVERCRELVASPHRRLAITDQAFEEFRKVDLVENVRKALEQS